MLRFLLRFVGLLVFAAAFIAMISDGIKSLAADRLVVTPLGQTWGSTSPDTLAAAQRMVETNLTPYLWNPVIQSILAWPTFAVGGMIGILLMLAGSGRRDRPVAA